MKIPSLILSTLVLSIAILAAPGDLDTTFGVSGGYVVSDLFSAQVDERGNDVAVQSDGKIIVVGSRDAGGPNDYVIVRYNTDGTLDSTFSGDGVFTLNNSTNDTLNAVVIQSDGKIVAVGESNSLAEAYVIRLNSNGTLDTTFSGDGILEAASAGIALSATLQTDGKIVVGTRNTSGVSIILRINSNGTLDTTFDTDGIVSLSPNNYDPYGLAIQTDGKIVVVGSTSIAATSDFSTVRLLSNGAYDTSFDGDGIATTAVFAGQNNARDVVIQSDGKLIVGGGGSPDAALVRYNSNGTLDTSFDTDGIRVFNVNNNANDYVYDLSLQTDGGILAIAGTTYSIANVLVRDDFSVYRFDTNGSLDPTFDANGLVQSQWCEQGASISFQTDGKIVAVGGQDRATAGVQGICTQRFNADGSVDTSLNFAAGDGKFKQSVLTLQEFDQIEDVAILPNAKVLVAGWGQPASQTYTTATLIRLNSDGTLDTTFMDEGVYQYRNSTNSTYFNSLKIVPNTGTFIVAGEAGIPNGGIVVKFNSSGALDTTFSGDGIATISAISRIYGLALQSDGKIIGCGSNGSGLSTRNGKIVRISTTGTLEQDTFVTIGIGNSELFECGVQSDGKLIFAGYGNDGTSDFIAVSRRLSTFAVDATFGTSGAVSTDLSTALNDRATGLVIQPDDKIVVTSTGFGADRDFAAIRYTSNGTLDTSFSQSFGSGGVSLLDFVIGSPNDEANAILLQPDGQFMVGGSSDNGSGNRFALAKVQPNGSFALGFGTAGRVVTTFTGNDATIFALAFAPPNKVLAAGREWNGTAYNFALARYENEFVPTAANVTLSGTVTTSAGMPVGNAVVSIVSQDGEIRTARTNGFGNYVFEDLSSGSTYVVSVSSKRNSFTAQIVVLTDNISGFDFVSDDSGVGTR